MALKIIYQNYFKLIWHDQNHFAENHLSKTNYRHEGNNVLVVIRENGTEKDN